MGDEAKRAAMIRRLEMLDKLEAADAAETSAPKEESGALDKTLKTLGYAAGAARTALAVGSGLGTGSASSRGQYLGNPMAYRLPPMPLETKEQSAKANSLIQKAVAGKAPPSSELFGLDPVTGFATDVVLDPTPAILGKGLKAGASKLAQIFGTQPQVTSLTAKGMGKLKEVLAEASTRADATLHGSSKGPLAQALGYAGKKLETLPYRRYDKAVALPGGQPVSEIMEGAGALTQKGLARKILRKTSKLQHANDEAISVASRDPIFNKYYPAEAAAEADRIMTELGSAANAANVPVVNRMRPVVEMYRNAGPQPLTKLKEAQKTLREHTRGAYKGSEDAAGKIYQALNRGHSLSAAKTLEHIAPGAGKAFRSNSMKLGSLYDAKPVAKKVLETGAKLVTPVDALTAAAGAVTAPLGPESNRDVNSMLQRALLFYSAKKLGQGLTSTGAQIYGGKLLKVMGATPGIEPIINQTVQHGYAPWEE